MDEGMGGGRCVHMRTEGGRVHGVCGGSVPVMRCLSMANDTSPGTREALTIQGKPLKGLVDSYHCLQGLGVPHLEGGSKNLHM